MISNIHKTVIEEIKDGQPKHQVLNDLVVSFCALTLSEIKNSDDLIKESIASYASKQLEFSFRLIQNYRDITQENFLEEVFSDFCG